MTVRHSKVSTLSDPVDTTLVGKTDWNAGHQVSSFAFDSGVVSPTQLSASQNDYNPTNWDGTEPSKATHLRLDLSAAWSITGLAGGSTGRLAIITNVSAFALTLAHENASSTAANRFALGSQHDELVLPGESFILIYDATSSRWRDIAHAIDALIVKQVAGSDVVNSTTSNADVTGLSFTAVAGGTYEVELLAAVTSNATTTGLWFGLNTPASPTLVVGGIHHASSATGGAQIGYQLADDTAPGKTATAPSAGGVYFVLGKWLMVNGSNAGTVQMRCASEVAVTNGLVVKVGTTMKVRRIA